MVVTPEVRVARIEDDGRQLRMSLFRGAGEEYVTVRVAGEHVHEVWIGDEVAVNEPGTHQPLTSREDLVGAIARKAREFVLLQSLPKTQRIEVLEPAASSPRLLGEILHEPYPELGDLDVYPETGDGLA
jgi:hypothetical protein